MLGELLDQCDQGLEELLMLQFDKCRSKSKELLQLFLELRFSKKESGSRYNISKSASIFTFLGENSRSQEF